MPKLVTNPAQSFTPLGLGTINQNFKLVEAAMEKTLSRDGTSPNQMEADLDLNGNDLINASRVNADHGYFDRITVKQPIVIEEGLSVVQPDEIIDYAAEIPNLVFDSKTKLIRTNARVADSPRPIPIDFIKTNASTEGGWRDKNNQWWRIANTTLHPYMFGENYEPGLTDMTEAVRSMHEYANEYGLEVSYKGVGRLAIDVDARIIINTSVDFEGWEPVILNGYVDPENHTWDPDSFTLIVRDPDTPLTGVVLDITGVDEREKMPTARGMLEGLLQGPCYAYVVGRDEVGENTGRRVPTRFDGQGSSKYVQPFAVDHRNLFVRGLSADMNGYANVWVQHRANPKRGWITIRNLSLDTLQFNNTYFLRIERNLVNVESCHFYKSDSSSIDDTVNRLIDVYYCAWVRMKNIRASGQYRDGTDNGSYVIHIWRSAEVMFEDINMTGDWGNSASNGCNGYIAVNCTMRRWEGHLNLHNMYLFNSTIIDRGVGFGWGGGVLHVSGCTFVNCVPILNRTDYGRGHWMGSITIEDCDVITNQNMVPIVDLFTFPIGHSDIEVECPHQIIVRNIRVRGDDNRTGTRTIRPVAIAVKSNAKGVKAPAQIDVSDIVCDTGWILSMPIDYANMLDGPTQYSGHYLRVSGIHPTQSPSSTNNGLIVAANTHAGAGVSSVHMELRDIRRLLLDVEALGSNVRVYANNVEFLRARWGTNVRADLTDCRYGFPVLASGESVSVLGGPSISSTASAHLSIIGGHSRGAWDFSKARFITGLTVSDGTGNGDTVLPTGCTRRDALIGWYDTSIMPNQSGFIPSYSVGNLNNPASGMAAPNHTGRIVIAHNANGGKGALCRSDGTNWIDLATLATVTT